MVQAKTEIPQQNATLQGVENDKVLLLTGTVSQLPEEMQNEAIEILIRYLNADAENRGQILIKLRELTEELNEQIKSIVNNE